MTETKELKPRSFRIDEETAEKFKGISAELGNNQQQTLSKLIETYEFQKGKTVLSDKKGEIETFEKYVTVLTRMYMASLEDNQNVTTTVQAEFEALLASKDETIIELQEKVKQAKADVKTHQEEAENSKELADQHKETIDTLTKQIKDSELVNEHMLAEKEKLITALTEACESYKKDVNELEKANLERNVMATKRMQLQKEHNELEANYQALKTEFEHAKIAHERQLLQKEIEFTARLQASEDKRKQEIDEYQGKYLELLQQIQELHKANEEKAKVEKVKEAEKENTEKQ
ncbi:MAG: hypothetical protein Q4F05_13215 [bacterium]|nr:hypothetical protein [bacterium]